ncbi:hypothetical protein CEV34_0362 [Brucella pseudogrignonensis]|uniref:Uncharacterized protein n=1 Tax=Brucella pseudogrignonensis TaxID=419475 RepID=A0A256GSV2_9HYPH|nr:hypothetical protein CEV34_0362 [Brucella pseudogrignonensis]
MLIFVLLTKSETKWLGGDVLISMMRACDHLDVQSNEI